MIQKIWNKILEKEDVRQNVSKLREVIKDGKNKEACKKLVSDNELVLEQLLQSEDAKTRKNTALLIGDLQLNSMQMPLWRAYEKRRNFVCTKCLLGCFAEDGYDCIFKTYESKSP